MSKEVLRNFAIKEVSLCARNPIYFIEKYCKVQHPTKGLVDFKLYDFQKEAITNFVAYDRNIVNKARQLGFSSLTAAFIVWLVLFHKDKSVLVVSTKAAVAKNMLKKVKTVLKYLPDWMYLADITTNQVHELALSNGSWVKSIARSEDAGRSEALSLLIIDEAAHIRDMDEMWKGLSSTVATGGKVIAMSTPKGVANWFYRYCVEAQEDKNGYHYQEVYWWENPDYASDLELDDSVPGGRTSSWFRQFTAGLTDKEISQELLTSFLESGDTYFSSEILKKVKKAVKDPLRKDWDDRNLWIWEEPQEEVAYLICADVAMGNDKDSSTFHILKIKTLEIVAEYRAKLPPDMFGDKLVEIAMRYNNAYIVAENNNVGAITNFHIKNKTDYDKLAFFHPDTGRLLNKYEAQYEMINPGFQTNLKTRPLILSKLEEFLRKDGVVSYSQRFVNELNTFIVHNGKPQAMKGHNDDLIMALAIGVWVRDTCPDFVRSATRGDFLSMMKAVSIEKKERPTVSDQDMERRKAALEKQNIIKIGNDFIDITFMYKV